MTTQDGTSQDSGTRFRLRWGTQLIGVSVLLASLVGLALFTPAGRA